ncbi:MAG: hypothetical protein U9Q82_03620, partial [Chloroflexota bacterium]|nr:hypothetical protein [Chloroflexota bacterium]
HKYIVSIPQSGECGFKQGISLASVSYSEVSIPQSGECGFKHIIGLAMNRKQEFQSLSRENVDSSGTS